MREEQAMFQCKAVAHVLLAKILGVAAKPPVLSHCSVALENKIRRWSYWIRASKLLLVLV